MKKLLFSLFAILAMVACADEGIDQITIDTTSVNFATVGGSTSVTFASSGAWTAEVVNGGVNAWCSVSPASGNAGNAEIRIMATANDTPDGRTATVVIKTGTVEKSIAVSQKQKDALDVSTSTFEFSAEGGEFEIEVGHNIEFDIEIDGDWITQMQPRALETSSLTFVVAENTTTQAREGSVTLTSKDGALSQVISVRQEAPRYEIIYTSSDGKVVVPYKKDVFGANIISNTYENGRGVITFDGPITSIGGYAFCECSSLTSITIPESVTSIGTYAFFGCSSLESVTIPDNVTSIGGRVFGLCSSLTSFYGKFASADNRCLIADGVLKGFAPLALTEYTIPDGITSIADGVFQSCGSLTSITIPNSITSIGKYVFLNCVGLTSVNIPNGVATIGERAFDNCGSLKSVTIPDNVALIEFSVFANCSSLTNVTIGNGVTLIKSSAFSECDRLTSVIIPNSVTEIWSSAFWSCSRLESVTIPNSVTKIGRNAFFGCGNLTGVYVSDLSAWCKIDFEEQYANPLEYAGNIYLDGELVTELTIPSDISIIKNYAFRGCSSLTSVTIHDRVTSIGGLAFYDCGNLVRVYCKSTTPPTSGNYVFENNASDRKIYVPATSVTAYKNANNWSRYSDAIEGYTF